MAHLISRATGLWSTGSTWQTITEVSNSFVSGSETAIAVTTTYVESQTFTPGAVEVSGVAVKLADRTGITGSLTIRLADSGSTVAGTETAISCSNLPEATTADLNGGWVFFKFASPVTLPTSSLTLSAKTSNASQVSLFRNATAGNFARSLVLNAPSAAPTTGDNVIICGEYLSPGSSSAFVVTYDITATTDFGTASTAANSLIQPGIAICSKGTFRSQVTAATNYNLKMSNSIIVYSSGSLDIGTSGSAMPSGSTFTLEFDCGANVDYGLTVRNLGTWNVYGYTKFTSTFKTKMTADKIATNTVIALVDTTGWEANDEICFPSTTTAANQFEKKTIATVDSGIQVTLSAGLTNAHLGTGQTVADVGNLTRNIKIRGVSTTFQSYIDIKTTAMVTLRYCEFYQLGSGTTFKRGIEVATTTGVFDMQYCSVHDGIVVSSRGVIISSVSGNNITCSNNVSYNINSIHWTNTATTGIQVWDNILAIGTVQGNTYPFNFGDAGSTYTNLIACGGVNSGGAITITETSGVMGTSSNWTAYGNGDAGVTINNILFGTITNITTWRNAVGGLVINHNTSAAPPGEIIIDTLTAFGNLDYGISISNLPSVWLKSLTLNAGTTLTQPEGIRITQGNVSNLRIDNSVFGTTTPFSTACFAVAASAVYGVRAVLRDCTLAGTQISGQTTMPFNSIVAWQKESGSAADHGMWKPEGTITLDTVIFDTTPSMRLTPNSISSVTRKLTTCGLKGGWIVPVASGATLAVSVKVRESVVGDGTDYNGARARLVVKANPALGVDDDVVIATATVASEGAWETISGTTPAATGDDGAFEFCMDCNSTTGWINVDTFTAT